MMTCKQSIVLASIAILALLVGCTDGTPSSPDVADADAAKSSEIIPISGQVAIGDVLDPGERFTTPGGVTHVTGLTLQFIYSGDVSSDAIFVEDAHYNAQGNGVVTGEMILDAAEVLGVSGSLYGVFSGNLSGFYLSGTWTLQGRGGLSGYHVRLHGEGPLADTVYDVTGEVVIDGSG